MKEENNLLLCTLSGTDEIGRNSNFVQYQGKILIVDMGFSFPGEEMLGIDYLIPNLSYLKKHKDDILGILLTHGHLDHTGALPYVLKDLGFPTIYGGRFGNALVQERLKEFNLADKVKIVSVDRESVLNIGPFKVHFIGVTHSIPNSFSIFIESPASNVFFSGDYKIDRTPANEPETDYAKLKSLRGKVDLALMESTNAEREGKSRGSQEVEDRLLATVKNYKKRRIVISMFSSLVSRLYSVLQVAKKTGRKVAISGRSLRTSIKIAIEQGYINVPKGLLITEKDISKYPDDKILFVVTGSQAERYGALNRIALNEHKYFKVKRGDVIILSASEIPENVSQILKMTDRLIRMGADIIKGKSAGLHETGHGLQDDMKTMFDLIQPKNVMPVHGSLTFRYLNKQNFIKWGMSSDNVLLTDDGQVWYLNRSNIRRGVKLPSKPILIDGFGIGDIGDAIIKDREQLAHYGVLCVVLNLSSKNKKLIANPSFLSRGFINHKTSKGLINELQNMVKDIHRKWLHTNKHDIRGLRKDIEYKLRSYIIKKVDREPIILPIII